MCEPGTLSALTFATAAASAGIGFMGQQANADAQAAQYSQNILNARAALKDTQNALTLRQMQDGAVTSQKVNASYIDEARRTAEAEASGASAGIGGSISLNSIIGDISRVSEENRVTLLTNWDNTAAQVQREKDAAGNQAQSRINSVSPGTQPNPIAPAVQLAGAGLRYETNQVAAERAARLGYPLGAPTTTAESL